MELFECSDGSLINPDNVFDCYLSLKGANSTVDKVIFRSVGQRCRDVKHGSPESAKAEMQAYRDHVTNFYADPFIDMLSLDEPAGSRH